MAGVLGLRNEIQVGNMEKKAMKSLTLFAERVIPAFRPPARRAAAAE